MMRAAQKSFPEDTATPAIQANDNVPGLRTRQAAADVTDELRTAHVWLDAGLSRPSFGGWETITDRALCGWLIAISACVFWAALLIAGNRVDPTNATAQMELLANKLERTAAIPSDTASEIARVIGQPWYDCGYVTCSAELQQRNSAVRTKLSGLLATKERANELGAAQKSQAVALSH